MLQKSDSYIVLFNFKTRHPIMYSAYIINLFILEHKNYYLLLLETEY